MRDNLRENGIGYLIAILATVVTVAVRFSLTGIMGGASPLLLLLIAVVAAAWYGGWKPGVLAIILCVFSGTYFLIEPRYQIVPTLIEDQFRLLFFVVVALLVSWLFENTHAARRQLAALHDEQKRQNEEIILWKYRYDAAVSASGSILYDSDRQTGDVVYGGGCESVLGYTAEELNGNISKWVALVHPDDRHVFLQEVHRTNKERSPYAADYRMIRKDGEIVWMRDDGHFADGSSLDKQSRIVGIVKNVTVQRRLEMERARLAERLTLLTDHTPLAVVEWDADFKVTRWAGQAEKMFGWTAAEVLGNRFEDFPFVHPDDKMVVQDAIGQLKNPYKEFAVCRNRNLAKTGEIVCCEWHNSVLHDESGQMFAVLSLILDVTERERAETSLRKSEEQLRLLADAMPQVVWIADSKGNPRYYNSQVQKLSGIEQQEDGTWKWEPLLHPEDRQLTIDKWSYAVETGTVYECEHRVAMKDGTYRWHLSRGFPNFDEAKGLLQWFGTATDIHDLKVSQQALKESEETLRAFYENSPLMMGVVEVDGDDILHIYDNAASCRFFEVPQGATAGKWAKDLGVPRESTQLWLEKYRASEAAKTPLSFEHTHSTSKGNKKLAVTVAFLTCIAPSRNRFCYVAEDVTDRRLAETKLREADRRKDEFIATLAHELRNPLAPIRTGLEVLKLAKGDDALTEEIHLTMERQTMQLIILVDDLLDVSRITQGKLELRKTRVPISQVIQSAVEASRPFITEAHHELTLELPNQDLYLHADPNRLAQVVSNLLNNAAKYTPEGGKIILSTKCEGNDLLISVADNGIGIPADMQSRIFEMFAQIVDGPLERSVRGLGIGLTLVKSLVEMHDGSIHIQSDGLNKGSIFTVRLPLLIDTHAELPLTRLNECNSGSVGRKVLVVDDNRAAAQMLGTLVQMFGNEVRLASDGCEAIRIAEEFLPEVILMDIGMPEMNGYEAARHIRRQPWSAGMKLIALTGWGQDEDRRKTKEAGFDYHLVKPAEPAELQRLLGPVEQKVS
jgi:PAS domain S-box-containing protein